MKARVMNKIKRLRSAFSHSKASHENPMYASGLFLVLRTRTIHLP